MTRGGKSFFAPQSYSIPLFNFPPSIPLSPHPHNTVRRDITIVVKTDSGIKRFNNHRIPQTRDRRHSRRPGPFLKSSCYSCLGTHSHNFTPELHTCRLVPTPPTFPRRQSRREERRVCGRALLPCLGDGWVLCRSTACYSGNSFSLIGVIAAILVQPRFPSHHLLDK